MAYWGLVQQRGPWKDSALDKARRNQKDKKWFGGGVGVGGTLHAGHNFWEQTINPKTNNPLKGAVPAPSYTSVSAPNVMPNDGRPSLKGLRRHGGGIGNNYSRGGGKLGNAQFDAQTGRKDFETNPIVMQKPTLRPHNLQIDTSPGTLAFNNNMNNLLAPGSADSFHTADATSADSFHTADDFDPSMLEVISYPSAFGHTNSRDVGSEIFPSTSEAAIQTSNAGKGLHPVITGKVQERIYRERKLVQTDGVNNANQVEKLLEAHDKLAAKITAKENWQERFFSEQLETNAKIQSENLRQKEAQAEIVADHQGLIQQCEKTTSKQNEMAEQANSALYALTSAEREHRQEIINNQQRSIIIMNKMEELNARFEAGQQSRARNHEIDSELQRLVFEKQHSAARERAHEKKIRELHKQAARYAGAMSNNETLKALPTHNGIIGNDTLGRPSLKINTNQGPRETPFAHEDAVMHSSTPKSDKSMKSGSVYTPSPASEKTSPIAYIKPRTRKGKGKMAKSMGYK